MGDGIECGANKDPDSEIEVELVVIGSEIEVATRLDVGTSANEVLGKLIVVVLVGAPIPPPPSRDVAADALVKVLLEIETVGLT